MALRIRLRRMGRKKAPTYRIVVAESSMPRDGRIVASIGHYNPRTEPRTLAVDRAQALQWLSKGATPSDTVRALLKKAGVFNPEAAVEEPAPVEASLSEAPSAAVAEAPAEAPAAEAAEVTEPEAGASEPADAGASAAAPEAETEVPEEGESEEPQG